MGAHDPIARRFVPDPRLVHRAHNMMLRDEDGDPVHTFVRQQWDAAFGATRVAMDALRELWPSEAAQVTQDTQIDLREALEHLEDAYHNLDNVAEEMVGDLMVAVQLGKIRTEEEFDEYVASAERNNDGRANDET